MATGRLIGQRGRRSSSAALHPKVTGSGKLFMEGPDGKLLEIANPNNVMELDTIKTRKLSADEEARQRRKFLRGRAGKVAGRGKTKPKSRVRALELSEFRMLEREKRQAEEDLQEPRPSVGRRVR